MASKLRKKQKKLTRELILGAAAALVVERGVDFSMEEVADRAGVSLRTVYRYYPGRDELVRAIGEELTRALEEDAPTPMPADLTECIAFAGQRYRAFGRHEELARASVALVAATESMVPGSEEGVLREFAEARENRNALIRQLIAEHLPDLPERVVQQLFAVSRLLASSVGWSQMTGRTGGLSNEEASVAIQWALKTLTNRASELESAGVGSLEEDL